MIRLLSVGISSHVYEDPEVTHKDASKVYSTFSKVFNSEFNHAVSHCLLDCNTDSLLSSFQALINSAPVEDINIFYFSGHGLIDNNSLLLGGRNSIDDDPLSWLPLSSLSQTIRLKKSKAVFVLDCCHAGGGFQETYKSTLDTSGDIFVIASSKYFQSQKATNIFADNLCRALSGFQGSKEIKLSDLLNSINTDVYASLSGGCHDLVLYTKQETSNQIWEADFTNRFKTFFNSQAPADKELLLYSLSNWDHAIIIEVLTSLFFGSEECNLQPCWLVRRAIGSILEQNSHSSAGKELINQFSKSPHWMERSIAIIANRNNKSDEQLAALESIIKGEEPISIKWLANLYLSEIGTSEISVPIESKLFKSLWGIIDTFDRYSSINDPDKIYSLLEKKLISTNSTELLNKLSLHASLKGVITQIKKNSLSQNKLVLECYKAPSRKQSYSIEKKWLLSVLYGDWRGLVVVDLSGYFEQNRPQQIRSEIKAFNNVPSIEVKVTLLTFFAANIKYFIEYQEELGWILLETHPWIRKLSINLYASSGKIIEDLFPLESYSINRDFEIGFYDFILRVSPCYSLEQIKQFACRHDLPQVELDSLMREVKIIKATKN